jgi:hypothetical protein
MDCNEIVFIHITTTILNINLRLAFYFNHSISESGLFPSSGGRNLLSWAQKIKLFSVSEPQRLLRLNVDSASNGHFL